MAVNYQKRTGFGVHVNTGELDRLLINMKSVCSEKQFKAICRDAFGRSTGHVREIVRKDLPHHYQGPVRWMTRAVKNGRFHESKGEISYSIPVKGERGLIGKGGEFKATATGANGRTVLGVRGLRKRIKAGSLKRQKITAQILKGKASLLPSTNAEVREAQQHNKFTVPQHFVMTGGKHKGEIWARLPDRSIRPATGIGVPQMPLNRGKEELQKDIGEYLRKRVLDDYERIVSGKWKV